MSIIRSDFRIEKTAFFNCGNALRAYYSNGSLTNVLINDCEEDGIESISSTLLINDISLQNIKGIALESSAGSLVRLKQGHCDKSNICLSVHDGSRLDAHSIAFSASNVGIAVQKKLKDSESGGNAALMSVDFVDVEKPFVLDKTSALTIDGKLMVLNATDPSDAK